MNKFMDSIEQKVMGRCPLAPNQSDIKFSVDPKRQEIGPFDIGTIVRYTLSYSVDAVTTDSRTPEHVRKQVVSYIKGELYGDIHEKVLELNRELFMYVPDENIEKLMRELIEMTERQ